METLTLFDQPPLLPEGFRYLPDFITAQEEQELIEAVKTFALHPMLFQGYTAKRKVASFGHDFNFTTRRLVTGEPIPQTFQWLLDKVATEMRKDTQQLAELLLTEYPPGAVINWHRDAPPFDEIAGISLACDCNFRLRPADAGTRTRKSTITLPVRRRSLYMMKGASRSEWEHSTAPVKVTRYSITVRTLIEQEDL